MQLEHLQIGDVVDVVAPASACTVKELKEGLRAIRSLGLNPRVPKNLFARSLLFANSDALRLQHFKRALYAADSKLLWCVRGGYGALRLMPEIARWKKPKHTKILLGYSDVTTLHTHFNQAWNWPTLHGPLLDRFGRNGLTPRERKELLGLLFGHQPQVEFSGLRPLNPAAEKRKVISAPVLGGNLTVLVSSLGTPTALRPGKCILFFEDRGERPHRVDRMLTQLDQAGWFKNCQAIVLGDFMLSEARDHRGLWHDVFPRFAAQLKIPLVAGLPVGHRDRGQRTLPLNTRAELHLGLRPKLLVTSGVRQA